MIDLLRSSDQWQRAFRTAVSLRLPNGPDVVNPESFKNLRVIIVGPAETVFDDLKGVTVDDYDVVVRLNNGMLLSAAHPATLGRRTDVLFHNLREAGERNAGAIPAKFLSAHGVKTLICPSWASSTLRKRYYSKRDELADFSHPRIKILPQKFINSVRTDLNNCAPTMGISAALFFLDCEVAELAIHGFTFFETKYANGYNDAVITAKDARAWVLAGGAHEPTSEKALLRKRLLSANHAKISLGSNLQRYLNAV